MKYRFLALILISIIISHCKQKEVKGDFSFSNKETPKHFQASETIDLKNKGFGPVDSLTFDKEIDVEMVRKGKELYNQKCIACHKVGSTFIGPPPNGILKRRTPEWVMNMILNPDEMLQKDSLAKALFMEFDGQLMTNQQVSEKEARAILEYFRTLDP